MNHRAFRLFRLLHSLTCGVISVPMFCAGAVPAVLQAGDLELVVSNSSRGIAVQRLSDKSLGQELFARQDHPLFTLMFRQAGSANETRIAADAGWRECSIKAGTRKLDLVWSAPTNAGLEHVSARVTATADPSASALRWNLRVQNGTTNWSLWRVSFPDVVLAEPGTNAVVFFPRGPGEVQGGVWTRSFTYRGTYPDGWCSMQFVAAYAERRTGLYLATHDSWGSTKELLIKSEPQNRALRMQFEHPAPGMGNAGNDFSLEGEAVWQLLRGDWYDAAMIYKNWAQRKAKWWPRLGREGRADTPLWMRELNAWAMTGGGPDECVNRVREFRDCLGLPVGFHWYNWHQIPFDNDYPHYFPAKDGFEEGVSTLKTAGVFPMPYINGRLWDSRDNGAEDRWFSKLALRAVTKKEDGSAQLETYGSKETNGEPVRLGVMCPSTPLWRNTVSNIVLRLMRECGVSGVYIDQIAAAAPKLCMDSTHGHPAGGGHWWTESYWKMLEDIRRAMPAGAMLTTECNAEPFIRWFDGYLTWHWQHDGQVPAFPAVYGGTIQMFGRAYRGGGTKDLALRMKAAQQLVYGEQLGWLDPGVAKESENAEFFRNLAHVRSGFARYFYAGNMARPPWLHGHVPRVKADWQWSGEWWVTTDAVLSGAWRLPRERRVLLLFVNVSDGPVKAQIEKNVSDWGITKNATIREVIYQPSSPSRSIPISLEETSRPTRFAGKLDALSILEEPVTFAPREVQAWEFTW